MMATLSLEFYIHCKYRQIMHISSQNTAANLGIFLTQRAGHSYFGADTLCIWRSVELRMSKGTRANNDKNGIGKKYLVLTLYMLSWLLHLDHRLH